MKLLNVGPLNIHYENGFLRYIRYGDTEILRMIYFALRDEAWTTLPMIIENEKINSTKNDFQIKYDCHHQRNNETVFTWKVRLEGHSKGSVTFEIDGNTTTDILKNRAGCCVLHPIKETPGEPVEITHDDGSSSKGEFPVLISPVNPFQNIRSMRWRCGDNWYRLDFEGDIFETEDQRNWTDASFKTFCTPLALPMPVMLTKGTRVHQKIKFSVESDLPDRLSSHDEIVTIATGRKRFPKPAIGVGSSMQVVSPEAVKMIRSIGFSHYRIDVFASENNWIRKFSDECVTALSLALKPEIILHLSEDHAREIEQFIGLCIQNRLSVHSILLLQDEKPSTPRHLIEYSKQIRKQLPGIKIGAGTHFNFNELNQNRFNPEGIDFISYAIHPQEHAFDDQSIIETLEAQKYTAMSALSMYKGLPVHISPITLRKRFNPYTKDNSKRIQTEDQRTDPRQSSAFCGPWTLGSIKQLIEGGASSLTYFQTVGGQGVMDVNSGLFAAGKALKIFLSFAADSVETFSSSPLIADGMQFSSGEILLWNYTKKQVNVSFDGKRVTLQAQEIRVERTATR